MVGINSDDGDDELAAEIAAAHASDACMWERERASTQAHAGQRGGGQGCRRRWPGTESMRARGSGDGRR